MSKLKRVKMNGPPDNRYLKREELERELVRKDKQALISDCLKIFDTNTILFEKNIGYQHELDYVDKEKTALTFEVNRLKARTLWSILNERIAGRIDAIRFRNGKSIRLKK